MATAEQTYSYLAPSSVALETGRSKVTLATSGGREPQRDDGAYDAILRLAAGAAA